MDNNLLDEPCDSVPLAARRFVNTNENKRVMCNHCLKWCDNVSQFIRHVTHAKLCLESYDPIFIKEMKGESKLNSKRKWKWANSEAINENQRGAKAKKYYVTNKVKCSPEGTAFRQVFHPIFEELFKAAKEKIEAHGKEHSFLTKLDVDKAMDKAFTWGLMEEVLKESPNYGGPRKEELPDEAILPAVFQSMEAMYKSDTNFQSILRRIDWKRATLSRFEARLYDTALNKAFLELYNEEKIEQIKKFRDESVDPALNYVFLELIVADGYYFNDIDELGIQLEDQFNRARRAETVRRIEATDDLPSKLKPLIETILKKRFKDCGLEQLS